MSLSMYQASVPSFLRTLGNLSAILGKAITYAETKKIEPSVLVNARLAPDMRPLSFQVQIACDMAKAGAARLAGIDVPNFPDTESTLPELQARIAKTIDFLKTVSAEQIDGSEERTVTLKVGPQEMTFKGQPYLLGFVLPNVYFHVTTAYAILRHNGLDIGKRDYIGGI